MELKRVKCKVCSMFENRKCEEKGVKVNPNKSRRCELFENDLSKVKVTQKLKATYIPFHERSRKEYKKYLKIQKEVQSINESLEAKLEQFKSPDILEKFRSSASEQK